MGKRQDYIKYDKKKNTFIQDNFSELQDVGKFIKRDFLGKRYCFFYLEKGKPMAKLFFKMDKKNLQHLCGIKYELGAAKFFDHLIKNTLAYDKILYDPLWAEAKIKVLRYFPQLFTLESIVYVGASWNKLYCRDSLSTKKDCLIIALTKENGYLVPESTHNTHWSRKNNFKRRGTIRAIACCNNQKKISNDNPVILCKRSGFKFSAVQLKQLFQ